MEALTMELHPATGLYPPLPPDEHAALEASIQEHGILAPILMWRGQIIDGAHRYQIATNLGLEHIPTTQAHPAANPWALALHANSKRRHLTESARALIAATMTTAKRGGTARPEHITADYAARLTGTSQRSIARAHQAIRHAAPALLQSIADGTYTLGDAEPLLKLDEPAQLKIVKQARKDGTTLTAAHRAAAKTAAHARAWRTIATHHTHLPAVLDHLARRPDHIHPEGAWLIATAPLTELAATIATIADHADRHRWQYHTIELRCAHPSLDAKPHLNQPTPQATLFYRHANPPPLPELEQRHHTGQLPQPLCQINENTQTGRLKSKLTPQPKGTAK